jgi:transcriptional regulator with XRE-family HTH domain
MTNINIVLSGNLKMLLSEKGITQKELSDAIGVPTSNVNNWIVGLKLPRSGALEKLAAFFGVTVADLFAEPGKAPRTPSKILLELNKIAADLPENQRARLLSYAEALRDMEK